MTEIPEKILAKLIDDYLNRKIDGHDFVRQVDDLIGNDKLIGLKENVRKKLDTLHETLALCVWDDSTEALGGGIYVREPLMRSKVQEFRSFLEEEKEPEANFEKREQNGDRSAL